MNSDCHHNRRKLKNLLDSLALIQIRAESIYIDISSHLTLGPDNYKSILLHTQFRTLKVIDNICFRRQALSSYLNQEQVHPYELHSQRQQRQGYLTDYLDHPQVPNPLSSKSTKG
jgi:hypothetical protein